MNDKQIAALVKKTVKKAAKKAPKRKTYDATLDINRPSESDADLETDDFFKEMKKREF